MKIKIMKIKYKNNIFFGWSSKIINYTFIKNNILLNFN